MLCCQSCISESRCRPRIAAEARPLPATRSRTPIRRGDENTACSISARAWARRSRSRTGRSAPWSTAVSLPRSARWTPTMSASARAEGSAGPPSAHQAALATATTLTAQAAGRSQTVPNTGGAEAQASRASVSTPARMSVPAIASRSRRSSAADSSPTASCRAAISAGSAAASSHEASVSSPARVRASDSSSNSDPRPNRSRSSA